MNQRNFSTYFLLVVLACLTGQLSAQPLLETDFQECAGGSICLVKFLFGSSAPDNTATGARYVLSKDPCSAITGIEGGFQTVDNPIAAGAGPYRENTISFGTASASVPVGIYNVCMCSGLQGGNNCPTTDPSNTNVLPRYTDNIGRVVVHPAKPIVTGNSNCISDKYCEVGLSTIATFDGDLDVAYLTQLECDQLRQSTSNPPGAVEMLKTPITVVPTDTKLTFLMNNTLYGAYNLCYCHSFGVTGGCNIGTSGNDYAKFQKATMGSSSVIHRPPLGTVECDQFYNCKVVLSNRERAGLMPGSITDGTDCDTSKIIPNTIIHVATSADGTDNTSHTDGARLDFSSVIHSGINLADGIYTICYCGGTGTERCRFGGSVAKPAAAADLFSDLKYRIGEINIAGAPTPTPEAAGASAIVAPIALGFAAILLQA